MRFGICNELFEGWEHADVFQKAREIGYDGVEISPFTLGNNPLEVSASERSSIKNAAASAGVDIIGLHWLLAKTEGFYLTSPDSSIRTRTIDYLAGLVDLCGDLGGHVMVFGSPQQRSLLDGVTAQQASDYTVEALKAIAPSLEAKDIVFCIEPLGPEETNFINTADEGWRLAELTGSPNVKIILDVKAMSTEGRPVTETIDTHITHAGHFHANDPNRRGPGFGDVDFAPIMRALESYDYKGYVSVEVFDFKPDPVTIATQSLDNMKKRLSKENANNG